MVVILNAPAHRRINLKIVYCGPPFAGKSANLVWVRDHPEGDRQELVSIETEGDTTLFLPHLTPGWRMGGMQLQWQLYAVPGDVSYNATKELVLQGADGVVFVASSDPQRMSDNRAALANLLENLVAQGLDREVLPIVLQWNQRDLQDAVGARERATFNEFGWKEFEAIASSGEGVSETLAGIQDLAVAKIAAEVGSEPPERPPPSPAKGRQRNPRPPAPAPTPPSPLEAPATGNGVFEPLIRPAPAESRAGLWVGVLLLLCALAGAVWGLLWTG